MWNLFKALVEYDYKFTEIKELKIYDNEIIIYDNEIIIIFYLVLCIS